MRNRFTSSYIDGPIGSTMLRTACSMLAGTLAISGYNIAAPKRPGWSLPGSC